MHCEEYLGCFIAVFLDATIFLVIQIREFEFSPEAQDSRKEELEKLMQDQEIMRSSLLQWCYASYGEVLVFSRFFVFYPKSKRTLKVVFFNICYIL